MTQLDSIPDESLVDIETLKSRCLGNAALLDRVLQTFTIQLDADLRQLQQAFSQGDANACARLSHRIKGMAANVEARSLSRHAAVAEQYAREHCLHRLSEQLACMQQDGRRLLTSLSAYGQTNANPSPARDGSVP